MNDVPIHEMPSKLTPEEEIKDLRKKLATAQAANRSFESNGPMKLLYALNRKCSEMADLLNAHTLNEVQIENQKDKTFERLKVTWNDANTLATAVKELTKATGATGNENFDMSRPLIEIFAKSRS